MERCNPEPFGEAFLRHIKAFSKEFVLDILVDGRAQTVDGVAKQQCRCRVQSQREEQRLQIHDSRFGELGDEVVHVFSELLQILVACADELLAKAFSCMLPGSSLLCEDALAD